MSELQNWANIAQIAQAIFVVVSFFFIGYQLRQATHLARSSNAQHLTEQAHSFNSILYQNPNLASLWYSHGKTLSEYSITEQLQYREMLLQWMIMHENIFYQWKRKLIDEEMYLPWRNDFIRTIQYHNINCLETNIEAIFPGSFGQEITRVRRELSR